jgi:hypothetical protein
MAGNSTRGKSPGSGYQGAGAKTDYSSRARDSYSDTIAGNQRQNNITSNSTTVSKSPGSGYQGAGAKTDYASNARDSYSTAVVRQTTVNKSPTNPIGRRYAEAIGPKMPGKTRGIGSFFTATVAKPPAKQPPVVAAKPVAKKPVVAKPAAVISNVTNEKLSPAKKAMARAKLPATRFGVVTGKTTGTTMRGGGGYGGGGTRGGGSLSGGGSGTRSAGTSRTGGTQRNDPVRG